jgi:hypothetical protein
MSEIVTVYLNDIVELGGRRVKFVHTEGDFAEFEVQDDGEKRTFRTNYKPPAGTSQILILAVTYLAQVWCREVYRITVLNQGRASAIFARLRDGYTVTACEEAIKLYGGDDWHRKKKTAWLDIADFFTPEKLDHWILRVQDQRRAAEKRDGLKPPADPQIRGMVNDVARARAYRNEEAELLERFGNLLTERQDELLSQAIQELIGINPKLAPRLQPNIKHALVRGQVLMILKRENTHG